MTTAPISDSSLVQFGVLDALLAGVYESGTTAAELRRTGDFGLGCGEGLGSEVVVIDGRVIEFTADAAPAPMRDDETLPFAEVCRFSSTGAAAESAPTEEVMAGDLAELSAVIESRLASRNLFHAVRIRGEFASLLVRVPPRAIRPFRPLADVTHEQIETTLTEARGTLLGFWGPAIYQGIAVARLHLHFIADDELAGGHVLGMTDGRGSLGMTALSGLDLRLPTDAAFLATELTHDEDRRIVAIENAPAAG